MRTVHDVLVRPIISEASTDALQLNKYTFEVADWANKIQIREAVEEIFNVHVVKVNTSWTRGKERRRGTVTYRRPDRKKAVVTLVPGDTIEVFTQ